MPILHQIFVLFLLLWPAITLSNVLLQKEEREQFSEELLLKPLPDRKILAHFHFDSRVPPTRTYGHHHHLFPKAIYQLVKKFRIREMELSFTQGRWNYERWGGYEPIASNNAKPPGVELWAVFDVPQHEVDSSWKNLTHALSGLFCASINFLESSTTYSAPSWGFHTLATKLRYGTLPREAVCTENLTPWLKLLPCRDKAGLSTLMDRPSLYRGYYHSQRLHLTSSEFDSIGLTSGIVLEQTLTVVIQPSIQENIMTYSGELALQPSWSLSSLFGREVNGRCVVADSSNVFFQLDGDLVSELHKLQKETDIWNPPGFEFSVSPDRVIKSLTKGNPSILYEFSMENYSDSRPFDLGITWNMPFVWSCPQAPLHASRFLMGSGNERGSIAILLKPTKQKEIIHNSDVTIGDTCSLGVHVFQFVPWYVKVYYHTLQAFVDEQPVSLKDIVKKMHVSPSQDKVSPGIMELTIDLPCNLTSAALSVDFDKGFLHIDEYPPDANQGFDIPSAVVRFPNHQASINFIEDMTSNKSPLLSKLQEKNPVLAYTEVLLVPLTTPDFSMPYNVITITCTVFALYFGSLLNVLRRRVSEEERYLKSKAAQRHGQTRFSLSNLFSKLRGRSSEPPQLSSSSSSSLINRKVVIKLILVAGIAVAWQYYSG
ncbi:GPI transamidase component PIG-T [Impatiens glandulifera]|uniref:GPI transamidase component PIG-T n=1 Tax=Impatiens glandulifera TaxID=253017 RepID=UPI001FB17206|nr:GPI transamidase component PIG-T [Impatiens glandulifera]